MNGFERYFNSLQGKKIAVLGLGVSNRPLVRLLLEFGCDVTGCDKTPREKLDEEVLLLEREGCRLRVGEGYLDGVEAERLTVNGVPALSSGISFVPQGDGVGAVLEAGRYHFE